MDQSSQVSELEFMCSTLVLRFLSSIDFPLRLSESRSIQLSKTYMVLIYTTNSLSGNTFEKMQMGTCKAITKERKARAWDYSDYRKEFVLISRESEKERLTDAGMNRHLMEGLGFITAARCSLKSLEQRRCVKNCIFFKSM